MMMMNKRAEIDFTDILQQIKTDIPESERHRLTQKDITKRLDSKKIQAKSEKEVSRYGMQYDRRDKAYSKLLENYIDIYNRKAKANSIYKLFFFIVTILMMIALVGFPIAFMLIMAIRGDYRWEAVGVIVGGVASMITAVIVLPKIIAEHLFPTKEDENMIEMVKNMQLNDSKIRSSLDEMDPDDEDTDGTKSP